MVKKGYIEKSLNIDIPEWKDSHNIVLFLVGSILAGMAFGIGSAFGTILLKGGLRKFDIETGLLPHELRDDVYPINPSPL